MNSQAIDALKAAYKTQGERLVADAALCDAMLRDHCPDCRKEIAILVSVVRCGAARQISFASSAPFSSLQSRLVERVRDEQGLAAEAAAWGVNAWRQVVSGGSAAPPEPVERPRTTKALALPPAEDIVRDWGVGKETPTVLNVVQYVGSRIESDADPQTIRAELVGHGIPETIADQILLKRAPDAGWGAIGGAIGLFVMCVIGGLTGPSIWSTLCLFGGIFSLVVGLVQRRRWRKWVMSVAMRNAGGRVGAPRPGAGEEES